MAYAIHFSGGQVGKKKKVDIWMPLYVADYISDTMHLTTEQHGAYLLLLMSAWRNKGVLNNDDFELSSVTKMNQKNWQKNKQILLKFFTQKDNILISERLVKEYEKATNNSYIKSVSGKSGAKKRWQNDGKQDGKTMADGMANGSQKDGSSSSPSPSYNNILNNKKSNIINKGNSNNAKFDLFIEKIKQNPLYKNIDIDTELQKLDGWLAKPANAGKKKTPDRIMFWLNNIVEANKKEQNQTQAQKEKYKEYDDVYE
jgi:uncharacterized protein YdaU (DUF1376 family)